MNLKAKGKLSALIKHEYKEGRSPEDESKKDFYADNTITNHIEWSNDASSFVRNKMDRSFEKTGSLSKQMIHRLPTFHFEELTLHSMLGSGSFWYVYFLIPTGLILL